MGSALRNIHTQLPGPPVTVNKFLDSSLPQFLICTEEVTPTLYILCKFLSKVTSMVLGTELVLTKLSLRMVLDNPCHSG